MATRLETLDDLFELQLKDLCSAENHLVTSLPLLAETAKGGRPRAGLTKPLRETEKQALEEEQLTGTKLNDLAKNYLNKKAE